jgi:tRNA G18 (ribose-2'-O)-methylase SpoU
MPTSPQPRGEGVSSEWGLQHGVYVGDLLGLRTMFHMRHVDSLELPELAPYRTMRRPEDHVRQRLFVAEGDKVVRRLLESQCEVVSALMPEKWVQELAPLFEARPENIPVFIAPKELLEQLIGFSMFQGVMAVGRFPVPASLDQLLQSSPHPHLLLALEGLNNAENLGVIVRNAVAFGVQVLIVGETCSTPYLRRAVRNSMGTVFKLPVVEPPSLLTCLSQLRARGIRCLAAHGPSQTATLARSDLARDCCVVLGSEAHGLSTAVLEACDESISIPMANGVDSLNVGNAGAVFLYEANRQRGRM